MKMVTLKALPKNRSGNRVKTGKSTMLHFGGDVANELDLLDFIDDEDERTQIKINYVLQHVVPMLKFSECTDPETPSSPFKSISAKNIF